MSISLLRKPVSILTLIIAILNLTACDSGSNSVNTLPPEITEFSASEATIITGGSTNLLAVYDNGTGSIDNGIGSVLSHNTVSVMPTETTTYVLTVINGASEVATQSVTVTVLPTPPALPVINSFSASQTSIVQGNSVDLTAVFENGTGIIDNGVGDVTSNQAVSVAPMVTTTYQLTVSNAVLESTTQTVTITVEPPLDPVITSFSAQNTIISVGDSVELTAVFENGTGNVDNSVGDVDSNTAVTVMPTMTTIYVLTVTNAAMVTRTDAVTITVVAAPVINSFIATQTDITEGSSIDLTGVFENGTGVIDNGIGPVTSNSAVSDMPAQTTTYQLTVTNAAMASTSSTVTVTVQPLAPVITSFTAVSTNITEGESVELTAVFVNGTGSINNGVGGVTSNLAVTVSPAVTTTYELTVTNTAMVTSTASITISVKPAARFVSTTGAPLVSRTDHAVTEFSNGTRLGRKALFSGGYGLNSAELYNTSTGTFTATGNMNSVRRGHTSTFLPNGTILITGGDTSTSGSTVATSSAELFDPATNTFKPTGSMAVNRYRHTATLMTNGNVLILGGLATSAAGGDFKAVDVAEVYKVSTGVFEVPTNSPALNVARYQHKVLQLTANKYLITGGHTDIIPPALVRKPVASAEIFDSNDFSFTLTGAMSEARSGHVMVRLFDGSILVQGGSGAEIYDLNSGLFQSTGTPLQSPWFPDSAALLQSGKVLLVGRTTDAKDAQVYDPVSKEFSLTANTMQSAHVKPTAITLPNFGVLIFGGGFAEIYN